MQIRIQSNKVQLIRSSYDSTLKRSTGRVIVSFSKWSDGRLSDEQRALLSDDEKSTLDKWLSAQRIKREQTSMELAIRLADWQLSELVNAIQAGSVSADQANAIWSGMAKIHKKLRAVGHRRPKSKSVADRARNPAQVELPI
ncbi:MAG: hypothetical protein K8H84_11265 [Sulfuricella denitrificans]|nr:hypothetical protein [Sulfuricella denitrificans]